MKHFVQEGNTLAMTADRDLAAGDGLINGALFGVTLSAAKSGETVQALTTGVVAFTNTAGATFADFAKVYWNDTDKTLVSAATGNKLIGVTTEAVGVGAASVPVRLNGVSL